MKIIVLHGDYETALYQRLSRFREVAKARGWQLNEVSSEEKLPEILSSSSLFSQEQFFVMRLEKALGKKTLAWLKKNSDKFQGTLVLYYPGTLTTSFLKLLPEASKSEEFKIPKTLFSFLDSLYPGNLKEAVSKLQLVLKNEPFELVFHLLGKHLRDVYWVKVGNGIPYPDWRENKLKSAAKRFEEEKLKQMLQELAKIDLDLKTGKADPVSSLDLFLARTLQ